MIAVDIDDATELYAIGTRILNEGLGPDGARAFLNLSLGGRGDWTKEKYNQPDMTEAELDEFVERARAEAVD
jgi:hypothetical protein